MAYLDEEKFLHRVDMLTEACGATYCTMLEMGRATSSMMKVRGATKSNSRNYIGNFSLYW